jgi:microcystin-dependent protein
MSCSNCYNGCTEIVSDQCVRYTGVDIPVLGIKNGDSLSYVEQTLIGFLVSTIDGSGIVITIPQASYCAVVTKYLPTCGDITANVLFETLVKAACDLQLQVTANATSIATQTTRINTIEADYVINCLTGVTPSSGTHNILQAVITNLCSLSIDVTTNYVRISDINTYIANYLAQAAPPNNISSKMVPYVAVPYFESNISGKFDNTGAGIIGSIWEKIYLCNGSNGTPDLRGRVAVGVTSGMNGTVAMSPVVDPNNNNPNYSVSSTAGSNNIILIESQMPTHTHAAVATVTPNPHNHTLNNSGANATGTGASDQQKTMKSGSGTFVTGDVTLAVSVTNASTGGSSAHPNFQPGIGCFYIMYIP